MVEITEKLQQDILACFSRDEAATVSLNVRGESVTLRLTPCGCGPRKYTSFNEVEHVLVNGPCWASWLCCDGSKLLHKLQFSDTTKKDWEEEAKKLRAYFIKHMASDDPECFSFYSDWHKDVFGYRPKGGWTYDCLHNAF